MTLGVEDPQLQRLSDRRLAVPIRSAWLARKKAGGSISPYGIHVGLINHKKAKGYRIIRLGSLCATWASKGCLCSELGL